MLKAFWRSAHQSLLCSFRRPGDIAAPLIFFVIVTSLFVFGIGPDQDLLAKVAPGIIWVSALLATLLSLHRLFESDLADGTLEQLLLNAHPTVILVSGKIAAHWITAGLPLSLIAPLISLQFGKVEHSSLIFISMLLGTLSLSLVGAVGAALSLGARGGSLLLALIVMPLYIPILILGSGALSTAILGTDASAQLTLMGAFACGALALAPWATSAALRLAVE